MGNFRGGSKGGDPNCPPGEGGGSSQQGGFMGNAMRAIQAKKAQQAGGRQGPMPMAGNRPPDQNGNVTPYGGGMQPQRATQGPGSPPRGGMNPMMQRQQMMAQQMRGGMGKPQPPRGGPPNPGGSRMPMRGGRGMRGGGRGMY